ncbi:MAG TPA: ABC transporter substrate-binding protein [Chloroflexota bacterium]
MQRKRRLTAPAIGLIIACIVGSWTAAASSRAARLSAGSGSVLFLSTQFTPIDEAETYRNSILAGAPVGTNFLPSDAAPFYSRIQLEESSHRVTIGVIGGLHGDLQPLAAQGYLQDVTPLLGELKKVGFARSLLDLTRFGGNSKHYYVPWMQATYIMAVNVKALKYLPPGVSVQHLTYDGLIQWGRNMQRGTGKRLIGLPAGSTGLIHRFIQGYLYPSFTHSSGVVQFRSAAAVRMWQKMKQLWAVTNPQSTGYSFMQEPLMNGQVWVAWDHVARLIDAVNSRPSQFRLVPAPSGPKGLGYLPVIAGLAIPKGTPDLKSAEKLISYLAQPRQQIRTLTRLAFFPATNAHLPATVPAGTRLEGVAVKAQSYAKNALPALLPIGLGTQGAAFNQVYLDTFNRIVVRNENISAVLNDEARTLQGILDQTKAPCWAPDKTGRGTCHVR